MKNKMSPRERERVTQRSKSIIRKAVVWRIVQINQIVCGRYGESRVAYGQSASPIYFHLSRAVVFVQ